MFPMWPNTCHNIQDIEQLVIIFTWILICKLHSTNMQIYWLNSFQSDNYIIGPWNYIMWRFNDCFRENKVFKHGSKQVFRIVAN